MAALGILKIPGEKWVRWLLPLLILWLALGMAAVIIAQALHLGAVLKNGESGRRPGQRPEPRASSLPSSLRRQSYRVGSCASPCPCRARIPPPADGARGGAPIRCRRRNRCFAGSFRRIQAGAYMFRDPARSREAEIPGRRARRLWKSSGRPIFTPSRKGLVEASVRERDRVDRQAQRFLRLHLDRNFQPGPGLLARACISALRPRRGRSPVR